MKSTRLSIILLAASALLWADTAPTPPQYYDPSRILEDPAKKPDLPSKKEPKETQVDAIQLDRNASGVGENRLQDAPSFVLQNLSINGNTVLQRQEIIDVAKPYVGQTVDSKALQELAAKITDLYVKKGYVTSRCIIPAQKVTNGTVRLDIIEDKLGRILLSGKRAYMYDQRIFSKYLQELQGKPIHLATLNRQLSLLTRLPVARVTPKLVKSTADFTDLILEITDFDEKSFVSFDNEGSRFIDTYRLMAGTSLNNLTGRGDTLGISLTTALRSTKYQHAIEGSYVAPAGTRGGKVTVTLSASRYMLDPDKVGSDLIIYEGKSFLASFLYEEPVMLFDNLNLWWLAGFEYKTINSQTVQNSTGDLLVDGLDKYATGQLGGRLDFTDRYGGYNLVSVMLKKHFEGLLGAMTQEELNRKEADETFPITGPIRYGKNMDPTFYKIYLSALRQQALAYEIIGQVAISGEYTPTRAPEGYRYTGGDNGDYGYNYSLSLRRKLGFDWLWGVVSYSGATSYQYDLELKTKTVSSSTVGLGLYANYSNFFASINYSQNVELYENNLENIKFRVGYSW
ncbi:MAG: hypothetical protein K6347_01780 [Campylobacterales bacterium]